MKQVKITELELNFLTKLGNSDFTTDGDGFCDWVCGPDYDMKVVRGVMSSLQQKKVIWIGDVERAGNGQEMTWVDVREEYFDMNEYKLTNLITK